MHSACHGPSEAQATVLGAHLAEAVHTMWPTPEPAIVPPRSDMQGFTVLHAAALASREAMAMLLLDAATHALTAKLMSREQASLESSMLVQLLRARDVHGRTPLHVAAGAANAAVRFLR
jgi:ankyrin repeat protein